VEKDYPKIEVLDYGAYSEPTEIRPDIRALDTCNCTCAVNEDDTNTRYTKAKQHDIDYQD